MRYKTDMDKMRHDAESITSTSKDFFKLEQGMNKIRVLPAYSEKGHFYQCVSYHRLPGRFTEKVTCPKTFEGTEKETNCPICARGYKVYQAHGKDASKKYYAQKRALLNVVDLRDRENKVWLMDAPASVFNPIIEFMNACEDDTLIDEHRGYEVHITRKQEGGYTKYSIVIPPKPHDLTKAGYDVDLLLNNLYKLDEIPKKSTPDEVFKFLEKLERGDYEADENFTPEQYDEEPTTDETLTTAGKTTATTKPKTTNLPPADGYDEEPPPVGAKGNGGTKTTGTATTKPTASKTPPKEEVEEVDDDPALDLGDISSIDEANPFT